jgi:hypothetical protein
VCVCVCVCVCGVWQLNQIIPVFLSYLPVTEDDVEAQVTYANLAIFIEQYCPPVVVVVVVVVVVLMLRIHQAHGDRCRTQLSEPAETL